MKNINFESKISFDYSFSTEERFAFRRFVEQFIFTLNSGHVDELSRFFDDRFEAFGFSLSERFNSEKFVHFLEENRKRKLMTWFRLPVLTAKKKDGIFFLNGSMEVLNEEMLVMEGEVDLEAVYFSEDVGFKFLFFTFSPRMRVSF